MDRGVVRTAATDVGLGAWAEALAREARPSIRLLVTARPDELLGSRLGGSPALPPDHGWPTSQGEPRSFIGQIRLDELVDGVSFGLPDTGMLSFFFDAQQRLWSEDQRSRGSWTVVWFPPDRSLDRREAPPDLALEARFASTPIEPATEWTIPPWDSVEMDRVGLPEAYGHGREVASTGFDELQDRLSFRPDSPRHRMFGYPDQIAGDMRLELGQPGAIDGMAWELLLQVDTDRALGTQWGDDGRLYFWIPPSALGDRTFERTWVDLQCY